jgi:glycosyltransferase involved in cell wall biosynthesis
MVQPYGLHSDNRRALISAARPVADRLKNRTISFIGMWAPRKGSRIWGEIVRRVSERIPDVRFSFLGTMTEPSAVRHDIGADFGGRIEVISEFSPDELPTLLSKCAVGAFPSYVEGFGLAVLEQLAAGIPTVAFDEGGPRDILQAALPELLVPTGNIESFANALARILESELSEYERLVRLSLETAQKYSWSKIAQDTIRQYRSTLTSR